MKKIIPSLNTQRLFLRAFTNSDAKEVQRMAGNKKVSDTTATIPHPYADGMAEEWIARHAEWFEKDLVITWAMELSSEKKLIGCMTLILNSTQQRGEIAYWVGEEFWGHGYCTEAAKAAIDYGFRKMNLSKITSNHMLSNPASGKVMSKSGMKQEGLFRQHFRKNGEVHDMVYFGILKDEWLASLAD